MRTLPGVGPMWDLLLDTTHTFAVGNVQAVVHNCGGSYDSFDDLTSALDKDKPVTVIGRYMKRVDVVADQLREAGYTVNTWKPKNFKGLVNKVEANRSWLRYWVKVRDTQLVDIGMPKAETDPRIFYRMERRSAERWGANWFRFNPGD